MAPTVPSTNPLRAPFSPEFESQQHTPGTTPLLLLITLALHRQASTGLASTCIQYILNTDNYLTTDTTQYCGTALRSTL